MKIKILSLREINGMNYGKTMSMPETKCWGGSRSGTLSCISADNTYPHCNLAPESLFMLWNIFETVLSKMIVGECSLARELLRGLNGISHSINFCNMNFPWKSLFNVAVIFLMEIP